MKTLVQQILPKFFRARVIHKLEYIIPKNRYSTEIECPQKPLGVLPIVTKFFTHQIFIIQTHIQIKKKKKNQDVYIIVVIIMKNRISNQSSNPGQGCLGYILG